jgi:hypothetical protein
MKQHTNNFWKYRKHSETEWAHAKTKELGGAPALGGSMFAVAYLLKDKTLRDLGWAQVDFVFGVNPVGTHLSNKSDERVKIGGFWEGVEDGWPQAHPDGYGKLGLVRGTLDGTPLDSQFPIAKSVEKIVGQNNGQVFGKNAYATEGWCVSNRGWEATVSFATLGTQEIIFKDAATNTSISQAKPGQNILIELKAALNQDWNKVDKGWVDLVIGKNQAIKIELLETDNNSGLFVGKLTIPQKVNGNAITATYGYLGFGKSVNIGIK